MARPINRDLIDPFDRELSRGRRSDGMSADGLSYSVANDLEKQMGQALAEYDARRKAPRTDVWGKTLEEDSPEQLRGELIDPFVRESSRAKKERAVVPRTYKVKNESGGDDVVSVDPITGQTRVIHSVAGRPHASTLDRQDYSSALRAVEKAQELYDGALPSKKEMAKKSLDDATAVRDAVRKKIEEATSVPESPDLGLGIPEAPARKQPENYGFISNINEDAGDLGQNVFERKPSKNGRLPLTLAKELLDRAGGDRALAEEWAVKAGYSIE